MIRLLVTLQVLARLARGRDMPPPLVPGAPPPAGTVSVVVPARDEEERLPGCLARLQDDPHVLEVLVVDDESSDRTAQVAREHGARVVPGAPLPEGWAGKAWALEQGLQAARGDWVVFLDADTRPKRGLIGALIERAQGTGLLSVAARIVCDTNLERMLMGSFLATIVWRFGPGGGAWQPLASRTIFNGQCIAGRRVDLLAFGGWARVRSSIVEDVALARAWRRDGRELDFADASSVLEVRMYGSLRESWDGWGRSLMAVDETPRLFTALDLLTIWVALGSALLRRDKLLLALRLLMLGPMSVAFRPRGWGYWLSPLADLPVAIRLTWSVLRPTRTWKGRTYAARTARR